VLGEIETGTYKQLPKCTFKQFTDIWLRDYKGKYLKLKRSTTSLFKDIIERLLIPAFSDVQISDIGTWHLQAYVTSRATKVSANTVRNELTVIKLIFKYAFKWGYIKGNPTEGVDRPEIPKPEIEVLSPDELEKLVQKAEKPYRTAFLTAFLTGMRAGELWGLKWSDIDWNSKFIHVRRALWKGQFQPPKSKHAIRKIDISDSLIQKLKQWKLTCPISEHALVFPSPEGRLSIHENVVKRHFNPALRRAGLRQVSFHSLRHSNASMRIRAGQNIKYIQTQLGHASISVTMDIYGHLFEDAKFNRQQVELLEQSFRSVRNPLENPLKSEKRKAANG
jgi:integrase